MPEVIVTQRAQEDLQRAYSWWAEHRSTEQAQRWYAGCIRALGTLESNATRCALASENAQFPQEIRQLNFGITRATHRAVFTITLDAVVVLRIRHLAQQLIEPAELE